MSEKTWAESTDAEVIADIRTTLVRQSNDDVPLDEMLLAEALARGVQPEPDDQPGDAIARAIVPSPDPDLWGARHVAWCGAYDTVHPNQSEPKSWTDDADPYYSAGAELASILEEKP